MKMEPEVRDENRDEASTSTENDPAQDNDNDNDKPTATVVVDEILLIDIYNHGESYLLNDGEIGRAFDWQDVVRPCLSCLFGREGTRGGGGVLIVI